MSTSSSAGAPNAGSVGSRAVLVGNHPPQQTFDEQNTDGPAHPVLQ
jgi:hypothetical protein